MAISLLVGGSSVFASTPQDLGIKNMQSLYQKHNKNNNSKIRNRKNNSIVGIVDAISDTGFTVNIKNLKTKTTSSADVITNVSTSYKKDGIEAVSSDLSIGQKVSVLGILDKTTNILTAKTVKIADKKTSSKRK